MIAAGASFICPAVLLTGLLGWIYARWGQMPEVGTFMNGMKAGVISIIAVAVLAVPSQEGCLGSLDYGGRGQVVP